MSKKKNQVEYKDSSLGFPLLTPNYYFGCLTIVSYIRGTCMFISLKDLSQSSRTDPVTQKIPQGPKGSQP